MGATGAEREAARTALAAVPDAGLQRLAFTGRAGARELRLTVDPGAHARGADPRAAWLTWVVAGLAHRVLVASGGGLRSAWDGRMGVGLDPDQRPDRPAEDIVADARAATERAASAGWAVSSVRVWPAGPGAIEVRLRLTERQVLDGRTDWLSVVFPGPITFTRLLVVEAPDGTVLTYGHTITATAGGMAFSVTTPEGRAPRPLDPAGRTRLVASLQRPSFRPPYRSTTYRFVLDCAGGRPTAIPDVAATCDRLVRDRYALLTPQASDTACSGVPGGDSVTIDGTAFGVPVSRGYDACYGETVQRWVDVLRVPARGRVLPRLLGPAYGAVTGATPRERRIARHAMAAVAGDLPAIHTTFRRQGGHRVTVAEPGQLPDDSDLSRADADWLAERVKQDIALRLQGNAAPAPGVLALEARLATLVSRATGAGWYVRVARAWPLRNGPYLVTIRLTERQLLDGRIDWERVIAGPRPRRDAVRIAVEAPDGTLVAGGGMPFPRGDAPPPPGLDGPTRLTIDYSGGLNGFRRHALLDCDGGRSTGFADVAAACAELVSDRYALLAPMRDRCVATGAAAAVHLDGTFRGVPIRRDQTACVWPVVRRWQAFLGIATPAGRGLADAPVEPEVVQPEPAAAERVPVTGANATETAAIRATLAAIPDLDVRGVRLQRGERWEPGLILAMPPLREWTTDTLWLATFAAYDAGRRLAAAGRQVESAQLLPRGAPTYAEWVDLSERAWPDHTPDELLVYARAGAERAAAAGLTLTRLRVWPTGPGAVALTMRMTERQFLVGEGRWGTTAFPDADRQLAHLLRVEAPDGTAVYHGASLGESGGIAAYGSSGGPPGPTPPPADLQGPTRLEFQIEQHIDGLGRYVARRYVLDCDGGASEGVADAAAACARLIGDRYSLLSPVSSESTCSGAAEQDAASLTGTVFGVPVQRGYGNCYGGNVGQLEDLLRVPSDAFVPYWSPQTPALPVTGATAKEERVARRATGWAGDLRVRRVSFSGPSSSRTLTITLARPSRPFDLPAAQAAWVAFQLGRDIAGRLRAPGRAVSTVRLAGTARSISTRGVAATAEVRWRDVARAGHELAVRGEASGLYVSAARGWGLRGGTYVLTVVLTDAQHTAGRAAWRRSLDAAWRRAQHPIRVIVLSPERAIVDEHVVG